MAYKPIRQRRYEKLRKSGFTRMEASTLSKIPEHIPYMAALRHDRRRDLREALKKGLTESQYELLVVRLYKQKGWSQYGIQANVELNKMDNRAVYKMLREYEDKYKDDKGQTAFKSPWVKRQKDFINFKSKFEKTITSPN